MAAHRWIAAALLLALAAPTSAHHSAAMYDRSRTLMISGAVREFRWASPHCGLRLAAAEGEWDVEMGPPYDMYRSGWGPRTLKRGDKITVVLNPARDGSMVGWFVSASWADGVPIGSGRQIS